MPGTACPKRTPRGELRKRSSTLPRYRRRPRRRVRAASRRPNRLLGRGLPATRSRGRLRCRGRAANRPRQPERRGSFPSRTKKEPPRGGSILAPFSKWGFSLAGTTPTSLAVIRDGEPARRQNGELPIPAVGRNTDSGGRSAVMGEAEGFPRNSTRTAPRQKLKAQGKHQVPRTMRGAARLRKARGARAAAILDPSKKRTAFRRFQTGSLFFQWGLSLSGATPTSLAMNKVPEPAGTQTGELPIPAVGENTDSGGQLSAGRGPSEKAGDESGFLGTASGKLQAQGSKFQGNTKLQATSTVQWECGTHAASAWGAPGGCERVDDEVGIRGEHDLLGLESCFHGVGFRSDGRGIYPVTAAAAQHRHRPRVRAGCYFRTALDINLHAPPDPLRNRHVTHLGDAPELPDQRFGQLNLGATDDRSRTMASIRRQCGFTSGSVREARTVGGAASVRWPAADRGGRPAPSPPFGMEESLSSALRTP